MRKLISSAVLTFLILLLAACSAIPTPVLLVPSATPVLCEIQRGEVCTLAGGNSPGNLDGSGGAAQFNNPQDVVIDWQGNLLIADSGNHAIRKVTPDGMVVTLAGGRAGNSDGAGGQAGFKDLFSLAFGPQDTLYIAEGEDLNTRPLRIRMMTSTGFVSTYFASMEGGLRDGKLVTALFRTPVHILVTPDGSIYVADTLNNRIRRIAIEGLVETVAGQVRRGNVAGYADGPSVDALFDGPTGIVMDEQGNLYVADSNNHVIRKVTPAGVVSTLAGNGEPGSADGMGAEARFNYPQGLAIDPAGNLYVADTANHMIRKITPEGLVSTLAGTGTAGYTEAIPSKAQFRLPMAVAVGSDGMIYVVDTGNHCIRHFKP